MASQKRDIDQKQKLACELLGTFLLTFLIGLNLTQTDQRVGFGSIAIGCVLTVLVYAFSSISGGHLNPAVTFAVVLQRKDDEGNDTLTKAEGFWYIVAQLIGGLLGGLFSGFLVQFQPGANLMAPPDLTKVLAAPLCEFLYTFLLCFAFLSCAVVPKSLKKGEVAEKNSGYGVAIGFVMIAARGAVPISGAALNPAVSLGINFMGPGLGTLYLPIYWAAQLAGGFAATVALHIVRPTTKITDENEDGQIEHAQKMAHKIEAMFDPEDTAEFLGTFFISLTICLNMMIIDNPSGIWSIAACSMVVVYAMGPVSGGVFNPALTIAYCGRWYGTGEGFGKEKLCDPSGTVNKETIRKSMEGMKAKGQRLSDSPEWLKYTCCQLLGAAAGAGMTFLMLVLNVADKWPVPSIGPQCNWNDKKVQDTKTCDGDGERHTIGQAFFAECFGTFFFCYVILSIAAKSANNSDTKDYFAFVYGACFVAAGYSFGAVSGGLLNPAVTLCIAILNKASVITDPNPLLYIGAQILGGVLAAVVFKFTNAHYYSLKSADGLNEKLVEEAGFQVLATD